MTLRDDIDAIFEAASNRVLAQSYPRGMTPDNAFDIRWVTVNENTQAIQTAIKALADRIDEIESRGL